jgi:hypothetical protein
LYNKLHNIEIPEETELQCRLFCKNSYKEVINVQIALADSKIPFTYTDTISLSELDFLYSSVNEYIEKKNSLLEKSFEELQ